MKKHDGEAWKKKTNLDGHNVHGVLELGRSAWNQDGVFKSYIYSEIAEKLIS